MTAVVSIAFRSQFDWCLLVNMPTKPVSSDDLPADWAGEILGLSITWRFWLNIFKIVLVELNEAVLIVLWSPVYPAILNLHKSAS